MPRQPRQFEIGEIYHIVNRGVEKRKIFLKNQDYSRFILGLEFFNRRVDTDLWSRLIGGKAFSIAEKLDEERARKSKPIVELLAFALMPNHYHLIVREIIKDGISLFMRKMGGYSTYFNKQYDRVGPLFQSRYKAVHIKDEGQLDTIFAYVHTNPVELKEPGWKEGKVRDYKNTIEWLKDYRWSSYRDYIGFPTFPSATQREFFLDFYGGSEKCQEAVEYWVKNKAHHLKDELISAIE